MNTQTKITTIAFMLALVWISYWLVCQSKVKASEKYMDLVQEKALLEEEKKAESEWWWVDEDAKNECIQSFTDSQEKRHKNNEKRDIRIAEIEKEMGLIESSQAQKKISTTESWSIMNDSDGKTQDNKWYKKLLNWVESLLWL